MKKKVLLKGPLLTRSGYGEQARFALRSLRSQPDLYDIFIQPLQWGKTSWIATFGEERAWIDADYREDNRIYSTRRSVRHFTASNHS